MKKWIFSLVVALCIFIGLSVHASAEMAVPPKPTSGVVVDQTQTVTTQQINTVNQKLDAYHKKTGVQIAVLMIPSLENDYLENYSLRVARGWGIGDKEKSNGVLLLIVKNDRKMRIEVGTKLEGNLTDARAGRIVRDRIAPQFRDGNFYQGILDGTDGIILAINAQDDPHISKGASSQKKSSNLFSYLFFGLFFIPSWLGAIFGRSKRWWPGGAVGLIIGSAVVFFITKAIIGAIIAGVAFGLIGLLLDFMVSRSYQRHTEDSSPLPWWIGGPGGPGSDSGGSGGGFSGSDFGGGDFGGGGASGDW